jgi:hypothetical protein
MIRLFAIRCSLFDRRSLFAVRCSLFDRRSLVAFARIVGRCNQS